MSDAAKPVGAAGASVQVTSLLVVWLLSACTKQRYLLVPAAVALSAAMFNVEDVSPERVFQLEPTFCCHSYVSLPPPVATSLAETVNVRVRPLPMTAAALAGVTTTFGATNAGPSTHSVCGPPLTQYFAKSLFSTVRTRHSYVASGSKELDSNVQLLEKKTLSVAFAGMA